MAVVFFLSVFLIIRHGFDPFGDLDTLGANN